MRTFLELEGRGQSWSSLLFLVFENQILNRIASDVLQGIYVKNVAYRGPIRLYAASDTFESSQVRDVIRLTRLTSLPERMWKQ